VAQPLTPAEEPTLRRRRRRRWPWLLALVVIAAAAFGAFAVETKLFTPTVSIPSVVGLSDAKARAALSAKQLSAVYAPGVYSTSVPADHVISQRPAAQASLKEGSSVTLELSRGLPPVTVPPSLTSYTCAQAQAALSAVHLNGSCPTASASYSATAPDGQVITYSLGSVQNPKTVPYGSTLTLVVSKGPPPVAVPSVSGSYDAAAAALQAAGFTPTQANQFSNTVPAGQVIGTSPASGTLQQKGATVTVYVSLGVGVVIPSGLIGEDATTAGQTLENLGLVPAYSGKGNRVVAVSPTSGETVTKGSTVTLTIK
jgi:serine/threonine-protein kinase